jgi:hypothetical protein
LPTNALGLAVVGHGGVRVLVAAVDRQPAPRRKLVVQRNARLSIWPRFSRISRIGEELGLMVTASMGRLTWVRK